MNRQNARDRLVDLIRQALHRPKARRPTKPTYASKLKRLEGKAKRSGVKSMRGGRRGMIDRDQTAPAGPCLSPRKS